MRPARRTSPHGHEPVGCQGSQRGDVFPARDRERHRLPNLLEEQRRVEPGRAMQGPAQGGDHSLLDLRAAETDGGGHEVIVAARSMARRKFLAASDLPQPWIPTTSRPRGAQGFEIARSDGDVDLMSRPKGREHGVQHATQLRGVGELQAELRGNVGGDRPLAGRDTPHG